MNGITLCWWGSDLRLADEDGSCAQRTLAPSDDPAEAIAELVAAQGARDRPARFIHQPEGLETHEIEHGEAGRSRLRRRLLDQFPQLRSPGVVWAVEAAPAGPGAGRAPSLLHIDPDSRLPAIARSLARMGVRLSGAWSLAGLVDAASARCGPRRLSLVATPERSILCCLSPGGGRWVKFHEGPDFAEGTLDSLRGARARFDEADQPAGFIAIEDGPQAGALREAAAGLGPIRRNLAALLAESGALAPGGLADFLPAPPGPRRLPRARTLVAAGGLVLASALACVHSIQQRRERSRREEAAESDRRLRLEAAIAAKRMESGQKSLARAACPEQPQGQLLGILAHSLPPSAVLRGISIDRAGFIVTGSGSDPGKAWSEIRRGLEEAGGPWQVEAGTGRFDGTDFTLRGRFRQTAGPPSPAGLAAACALFPTPAGFGRKWREWGATWSIRSGESESYDGFEIRHYLLARTKAPLEAWPEVVATVEDLCRQPGLAIERLDLAAGPAESDGFSRAEIAIEVRLRPPETIAAAGSSARPAPAGH